MLTLCCFILQTTLLQKENHKEKPFYSVKLIFQENWGEYLKTHNPREIEIKEVEKMLSCKNESRGGFWYYCKRCDNYEFVPFGCNSRLCSCCGRRYTDQWASMLADKLIKGIFHRHLVFGIPDMLWKYFQKDRKLYKILMDAAYETIRKTFSKINHQNVVPGVIEVYHPFGRDIKHQPHVHMIVTEGGFTKEGRFVSLGNYIFMWLIGSVLLAFFSLIFIYMWVQIQMFINMYPHIIIMVYHEIREVDGKKQNYLVYTKREGDKIIKKSKFIGSGVISKVQIERLKDEFEVEIFSDISSENLSKEQLLDIERLKKVYHKKIRSLSKEEFEKFENTFFTELTYDSNAIEGSSLSLEDTNLVINEGLVPKGKTLREINEAKNHIEAIRFINEYKGDLNEQFILKLHSIILKNISERFAGRYRETSVRIFKSDVSFADASKVPQLVGNLVYWYKLNKNKMHPFELAIIFSVKLVSIHPFIDGNGRVSRLIMNFLLKKRGYPWINIYTKQRVEYLTVVRKANDGKYRPILEFCILTLKENLRSFNILED